ncbi:MAG: hypothetical protein IPQ07_38640, partial [Myxococcales bacterium]|nr:hypothetical protein [Myxococcales bacterium]
MVFKQLSHVRPSNAELRIAILRAVSASRARSLRICHLGDRQSLWRSHPLPSNYVQRTAVITRLRALSTDGEPIKTVDDDISIVVNVP